MIPSLKDPQQPNDEDQLDKVFKALSDRTRREILRKLSKRAATVSELADPLDMSLPAASKHIKVLEYAGLVKREKSGRVYTCTFQAEPIATVDSWLDQYRIYWNAQLDELAEFFEGDEEGHGDESE